MSTLASAICQWCEQEFFYPPARIGQGLVKDRRTRKRRTCDLCRGDEKRVRRIKNFGPQAADDVPLTPQEQAKIDFKMYVGSTQIIQPHPYLDDMHRTVGILGHLSADRECEHGRLPGDMCPSPSIVFTSPQFEGTVVQNWPYDHPCPCWDEENGKVPERPNGLAC